MDGVCNDKFGIKEMAYNVPAVYDVGDFSPMPARIRALRRHIAEASFHRNATRAGKMWVECGVGMSEANDLAVAEAEAEPPTGGEA
jgi:hypothetical protein